MSILIVTVAVIVTFISYEPLTWAALCVAAMTLLVLLMQVISEEGRQL